MVNEPIFTDEKVMIFHIDDKSLELFSQVASNKTGRSIILILMEDELYTNEIATKLHIDVSLVIHHLKKLETLNLLDITEKPIVKKGKDRRHFKFKTSIYMSRLPKVETEKQGILKKIFKESVKFASIGIAAIFSWMIVKPREIIDDKINPEIMTNIDIIVEYVDFVDIPETNGLLILSIIIPILVISLGFNIERILSKLWNKKKKKG